jgi:hypothetical protein
MDPLIFIGIEIAAWALGLFLISRIVVVLESSGIAKSALDGEFWGSRRLRKDEVARYAADLGARWHLVYLIPTLLGVVSFIVWRRVFDQPSTSALALKVLAVASCVVMAVFCLYMLNEGVNMIHGPTRDKWESERQSAAADFARITETPELNSTLDLRTVQKVLRRFFLWFNFWALAGCLLFWALFIG